MMNSEQKQLLIDYKMAFNTEGGKRIIKDLMNISNFNVSVIPRDGTGKIDPFDVVRREGQRSVIIHIIRQMEKVPKE